MSCPTRCGSGPGDELPPATVTNAGVPDRATRSRITPRASRPRRSRRSRTAFSLLEVMIACGIFFMAVFAILAMVSSVLRNARSLRRVELDAGMVAAQVCNTNKLYEGTESGDFGNLYPGLLLGDGDLRSGRPTASGRWTSWCAAAASRNRWIA